MIADAAISPKHLTQAASAGAGEINWSAVVARLARDGFDLDVGESAARFPGGLANVNIRVMMDGKTAVFRCPPSGPLPRGSHDMVREHRVLSRLAPHWPMAPNSLYLCEDRSVIGVPFQILEYKSGIVVRGATLDPLAATPTAANRLSGLLVDTLVSLHALDAATLGLGDLGRPKGFLTRTLEGWTRRACDVLPHPPTSMAMVVDWLRANLRDRDVPPTLLHSDFKLDNVILAPDGNAVNAVLDWDMATQGDPLFDLATLLSYWAEPGDPPCMERLAQMPTLQPGFGTRREVAEAYSTKSGRDLTDFLPIRVLGMFKLGIVFHQLHVQHGGDRQQYAGFDILANDLLQFAADTARSRII